MSGEWFGDEIAEQYRKAALEGIVTAIGIVETEVVRLITTGPKTGRIYKRRSIEHQSSAGAPAGPLGEGESPANDTNRLLGSRRISIDAANLSGLLIFSTDYAWYLEYGTTKMEPRPFARPAIANKHDDIVAAIITPMLRIAI